jgi:uncharacterized protein (DUF488 family)
MHEVYAIGHSTRSIEEFIELLKAHDVKMVVDIRTIPKSRHCPQFNALRLKNSLSKVKIGYRHIKELGGLRHTRKDSPNTSWENASFRGYADHMQTEEFQRGLEKLEELATKKRCAMMCAESVPWRCHRSLVADALTVRHWKVYHIQSRKTAKLHALTRFLRVTGKQLIYDR